MRILYITRLFSGLEETIVKKKWIPTGVPTIYKIIESLDKEFDLHLIFNQKKGYFRNKSFPNGKIKISGIKNKIILNKYLKPFRTYNRLNTILSELFQLSKCIIIFIRLKPDIIYFDNSNIITASFFSRIFNTPVCLRIMGVYPVMKNYYQSNSFISKFYRYLYSSSFDLIIGTQDGSGTEFWLENAANKNTKKKVLINGVHKNFSKELIDDKTKQDKLIIGFVGKLEKAKGADLFVQTSIKFLKSNQDIIFHVVGSGSLFEELNKLVTQSNLNSSIIFHEFLEHKQLYQLMNKFDLYVSLNKYGNLSNTNLEAISLCKPMIILNSDKKNFIDVFVDKFLPNDSVYRIERENIKESLLNAFIYFSRKPEKLSSYSKNISKISKRIPSWENRINDEINLLKKLHEK